LLRNRGFLGRFGRVRILSYTEEAVRSQAVTFCAEFPNDNADLHLGAVWICQQVTGPAVFERPAPHAEPLLLVEEALPEPLAEVASLVEELVSPPISEVPSVLEAAAAADPAPEPSVEVPTDPAPANAFQHLDAFIDLGRHEDIFRLRYRIDGARRANTVL